MAANQAAASLTEQHRRAQATLGLRTVQLVRSAWPLVDPDDIDGTVPRWLRVVTPIVDAQRTASARLAGNYVRTFRSLELGTLTPFDPVVAARLATEQIIQSLTITGPIRSKAAIGRGIDVAAAMRLGEAGSAGSAMRNVLNGGRETIVDSVRSDQRALGWARATSGNPCGFCAMLASRGPDYGSEDSAGFQAHDSCACTAEPVYRDNAPWPAGADRYRQLWEETTAGLGGQDAINAFRTAIERPAA